MTFIPIWQYVKKYNIPKQNIYRWIRENKIPQKYLSCEKHIIQRITIDDIYQPSKKYYEIKK